MHRSNDKNMASSVLIMSHTFKGVNYRLTAVPACINITYHLFAWLQAGAPKWQTSPHCSISMIFNVYSSDVQNIFHMGAVTRNSRKKDQTRRKMLPELCKSQHLLNSQECNNPTLLQCKCHGGCTCACRLGGLFHSHHFWHCHGVTDWLVQILHSPFRRSRHHRLGRHRPALLLHHGLHIGIGQVVRSDGRHQGNKTWTICVWKNWIDYNGLQLTFPPRDV